ncbi:MULTISPECIES: hypothetical protein [Comamonadaceae]|uniref:Sugar phosphate isomerase/epimerase n=2 Tax=Comamonadaceae TaxID=80864 RepID=A0A1I2E284_9BURK|nr:MULTISPECIES: hypothetical protein [Comamonadaceae]MDR7092888.1 hypothetical protein [Hydrogenophaga laconesensis]NCU65537.1 hypothetical protein [Acidovorax sp. 210-6]GAO20860.1 hypothetical protein ALISP_0680 [Alicycliphilus sp. B1]SFE86733.1 hypothetical protein SAMN04489711_106167 [Paracidovorax wautersii]
MKAHVSLACWPGMRHEAAAALLHAPIGEPLFGPLSAEHVQLVPQSTGCLTEDRADALRMAHPRTRFRLHANVHVLADRRFADLSGFTLHADWFVQAARISRRLGAPAYTAHAGRRAQATLSMALEHARRCADLFGCPVGIEGHYPTPGDTWLVSSWSEYRAVFESGVPYALDLSHLHILATATGRHEPTFVAEMLACERCIEVHVSDNDGRGDWHQVCTVPSWWYPLLIHIQPSAVVFSEGNHRRTRNTHVH